MITQDAVAAFDAATGDLAFLSGFRNSAERRRLLAKLLDGDLKTYLNALPDLGEDDRAQIIEVAGAFVDGLGRDAKVLAFLPALTRLKWHLAQRRLATELVKVVRYERGKLDPAIIRNPIRRYVVYPYWKDDKVKVPDRVYLAREEVQLRSQVHEVRWEDGRLVVTGDAYIHSVSNSRKWTAIKGVLLCGPGRRRIRLLARQTTRRGKAAGHWTGFTVAIDPRKLRHHGRWRDGRWDVHAAVFNAGVYRRAKLRGGVAGSGANPPYTYVADGVRVVPEVTDGRFTLRVETVRALATGLSWSGDTLTITGELREGLLEGPVTELTLTRGEDTLSVPAQTDGARFTAAVHVNELPAPPVTSTDQAQIDDTEHWTVAVETVPLVAAEDLPDAGTLIGPREAGAGRGAGGYLRVSVRTARLLVSEVQLTADATLTLTARHPVATGGQLVLRGQVHSAEYAFDLLPSGEARIPLAAVPTLAGVLPLRCGVWDVLFREGPRERPFAVSLAAEPIERLPMTTEVNLRTFTVESRDGRLVVKTSTDLTPEELRSGSKLRQEARRQVAKTGLREAVLFSCFNGRQYADSTRAIHEELARRAPDLEQLWVVADGQVELPDTVKAVRYNGREWHEALAACTHIVTNHRFGDWFQRHPDQTVLQTWHGTPLKKIGRDVKEVHFAHAPGMRKALQSAAMPAIPEWTHLISPNPFSTEIMRRAFAFKGEIIEAGYPRNDLLYSPDAEAIGAEVRARVGVPPGKRVVLYAPTWRDDQFYGRGRYKLDWRIDLDRFRQVLGDDHVLLVRLHPNIVDGAPPDDLVRDVSAYPDITELYLAADVLVSDYSSVMFDFANTRKPQLFFTYDLAHYRDTLRGFYFDFEAEAPGPLLKTSAQLIAALRDIEDVTASYKAAYDAFCDRFCSLEDGKAAARVVDRLFPELS